MLYVFLFLSQTCCTGDVQVRKIIQKIFLALYYVQNVDRKDVC